MDKRKDVDAGRSSMGEFFAIDQRAWRRVCRLGMNAATAYLVLVRGSGGDNRTTFWSANAIEKWTGISRGRAHDALRALAREGLIRSRDGERGYHIVAGHELPDLYDGLSPAEVAVLQMVGTGERYMPGKCPRHWRGPQPPRDAALELAGKGLLHHAGQHCYQLIETFDEAADSMPQWIWLPNALVTGAGREMPPVELVRQSSVPTRLRLLVDLYSAQSLRDDGGIHWHKMRQSYTARKIGQRGEFAVYGFSPSGLTLYTASPFVAPYRTGEKNGRGKDPGHQTFFDDIGALERLGLLQFVPHLIEADTAEAEILYPVCTNGLEGENAVGAAAAGAAYAMLLPAGVMAAEEIVAARGLVAPVRAHIEGVAAVGIGRLRYRPKTKATAAWAARSLEQYPALAAGFIDLAKRLEIGEKHVA